MGFRDDRRRRRVEGAKLLDGRKTPVRRGQSFTLLSFIVLLGCLALMKALNPTLPLRSPLVMISSVALACFIMTLAGRQGKKD